MVAVDLPLLQGIELNLNQLEQYFGAPVHNGMPETLVMKNGDQYHEETMPIAVNGKTRLLCQLENMDIDNGSQPITRPTPKAAGKQCKQAPKPILLSGKRRKYDFLNSFVMPDGIKMEQTQAQTSTSAQADPLPGNEVILKAQLRGSYLPNSNDNAGMQDDSENDDSLIGGGDDNHEQNNADNDKGLGGGIDEGHDGDDKDNKWSEIEILQEEINLLYQ
ncbi:hypothetical protein H0H87_007831 [Tephrocybe sp. NHM501043]|nr:hypothetical protein H0H87_009384 [Tephrocybe sp. NHM501043]KAG6843101.1 hypothetical protein H0H87_007832 [Tephrocybe sp. NHM501043]KAG6854372.1 hypothetical protein H0H87_007831 [Tephrocybe sp. NHM501043]